MVIVHILAILVLAGVIYVACEWFVNAIEWLGIQLDVGETAVGTVLAAIGTALPETVITLIAVTFGRSHSGAQLGVGAAMGGPLVLATIAYGAVGVSLLVRRRSKARVLAGGSGATDNFTPVDRSLLIRGQIWFLSVFAVVVFLGLVSFPGKRWLGFVLIGVYGWYVWRQLRADQDSGTGSDLEPLRLGRTSSPSGLAVWTQTLVSLAVIFVAAQAFVGQLEWAGPAIGLPAVVVALLFAPIATELPEIANALIWVRQGKEQLGLANVSGAMMVQATIPAALGLLFTPWHFGPAVVAAAVATIGATIYLLVGLRRRMVGATWLAGSCVFYAAFGVALACGAART